MKKVLCTFMVMLCSIVLSACGTNKMQPVSPNALVPAIMHDGKIYCTTGQQMAGEVDESSIVGRIASVISITQWPNEDGEANFKGALDAPYAVVADGIVVLIENEWVLFDLKSE